jgi:uncharacterized C2H2 Zn-finger protein
MSLIDDAKAAGVRVFDGKTPNKCPDCDFVTTSFREYTSHLVNCHPPDFGPPPDVGHTDPVLDACVNRCLRSLFTGDPIEGLRAMADFAKARKGGN